MTLEHPMDLYPVLRQLYDECNAAFFRDQLPPCMIVLRARSKRTMGAYSPECWGAYQSDPADAHIDTLVLNSEAFKTRSEEEICSTLVHEMCHAWEFRVDGTEAKNGHHDRIWGAQMVRCGLMPSSTGQPGGKQTGRQMAHYILDNGAFQWWFDRRRVEHMQRREPLLPLLQETPRLIDKKRPPKKYKHVCPTCVGVKAWALDGADLLCGACQGRLYIPSAALQVQTDLVELARQVGRQPEEEDT